MLLQVLLLQLIFIRLLDMGLINKIILLLLLLLLLLSILLIIILLLLFNNNNNYYNNIERSYLVTTESVYAV
jgi:hypothetical protein